MENEPIAYVYLIEPTIMVVGRELTPYGAYDYSIQCGEGEDKHLVVIPRSNVRLISFKRPLVEGVFGANGEIIWDRPETSPDATSDEFEVEGTH